MAGFRSSLGRGQFYEPWQSGIRSLARSADMGRVTLQAARDIAGTAGSVGRSTYGAAPYTVVSGRSNESRAGAIAYESERDFRDVRDETLKRTAAAMHIRADTGDGLVKYTKKDGTTRWATQAQYNNWMRQRGAN